MSSDSIQEVRAFLYSRTVILEEESCYSRPQHPWLSRNLYLQTLMTEPPSLPTGFTPALPQNEGGRLHCQPLKQGVPQGAAIYRKRVPRRTSGRSPQLTWHWESSHAQFKPGQAGLGYEHRAGGPSLCQVKPEMAPQHPGGCSLGAEQGSMAEAQLSCPQPEPCPADKHTFHSHEISGPPAGAQRPVLT